MGDWTVEKDLYGALLAIKKARMNLLRGGRGRTYGDRLLALEEVLSSILEELKEG